VKVPDIKIPGQAQPIQPFSVRYYAVKDLNERDIKKLKTITYSKDQQSAHAAGLILARHYTRENKMVIAERYYKLFSNDAYFGKYMKLNSFLWNFDYNLKKNNLKYALHYSEKLKETEDKELLDKVLKPYCLQEDIDVKDNDMFNSCVIQRINPEEVAKYEEKIKLKEADNKTVENSSDNKTDDFGLMSINISVTNAKGDDDLIMGMMLAVSKNKLPIKIKSIKNEEGKAEVNVNAADINISAKNNIVDFNIDMEKEIYAGLDLLINKKYKNLVILHSNQQTVYEKEMSKYLDAKNINYKFINYESKTLQRDLKIMKQITKKVKYSYLVIGDGKKHHYAVSLLNLYSFDRKKIIAIAAEGLDESYIDKNYAEYFRDHPILTSINIINNDKAIEFSKYYEEHIGKKPSYRALIGHDIIEYINRLYLYLENTDKNEYLTGIKQVDNTKAYREIKIFKIKPGNKVVNYN